MMCLLRTVWQDQRGQDLVEYALLAILIALVVVSSVKLVGDTLSGVWYVKIPNALK